MTVEEAIKKLQELPPKARLMCPDMGVGGSVDVTGFEKVDENWIDVMLAPE